jgi:hypothetical protein
MGYHACLAGRRVYVVGVMNRIMVYGARFFRGPMRRPMGAFIAFSAPARG